MFYPYTIPKTSRIVLYYNTLKHIKSSQVINRVRSKLGIKCPLGVAPSKFFSSVQCIESPECLDFDPIFLNRFSVDEIVKNKISFLHTSKDVDWNKTWDFKDKSALWNFNLHYFEYLYPLTWAWKTTKWEKYLEKAVEAINGWIDCNHKDTRGFAWSAYTIALRLISWLSFYHYAGNELSSNISNKILSSIHEQYIYLSMHLEKDILGNHYFEDLKCLLMCSLFFKDEDVYKTVLPKFEDECKEEILADGMHFELSPMYHKIVFEGIIRVAIAVKSVGRPNKTIESFLQPMLDVAFSFEEGIERIPLFNDSGNNISKSLDSFVTASWKYFNLKQNFKNALKESGFYFFKKKIASHNIKLIVDAGQPSPQYISGHAHCDTMSYELFCDGKPVISNCGTYAYQCEDRDFFRSTVAHNTVMINETEQSQCWGAFRLGNRSQTQMLDVTSDSIQMEMEDQRGQRAQRTIELHDDHILIKDISIGNHLKSIIHFTSPKSFSVDVLSGECESWKAPYSIDYGTREEIESKTLSGTNTVQYTIRQGSSDTVSPNASMPWIYRGYKPLFFLDDRLYLFQAGSIWISGGSEPQKIVTLFQKSVFDKYRTLVRFFRREPRFAIPIDKHKIIVAISKKIKIVDIQKKDVRDIFASGKCMSVPLNLCKGEGNWIALWGDYGQNPNHEKINIHGLKQDLTIETIYSFPAQQIRHIHNIVHKKDGGFYIFTGDQESLAGIYEADEEFKHVVPLKTGSQQYRAVIGCDTSNGLLYATDSPNDPNYIYLLKSNGTLEQITQINGSCIYGTEHNGSYYFATTVEPDETKRGFTAMFSKKIGKGILSDEVHLIRVDDDLSVKKVANYKKDKWPLKLLQYGSIQFPYGDSKELWIYPVAVEGFDGIATRLQ